MCRCGNGGNHSRYRSEARSDPAGYDGGQHQDHEEHHGKHHGFWVWRYSVSGLQSGWFDDLCCPAGFRFAEKSRHRFRNHSRYRPAALFNERISGNFYKQHSCLHHGWTWRFQLRAVDACLYWMQELIGNAGWESSRSAGSQRNLPSGSAGRLWNH